MIKEKGTNGYAQYFNRSPGTVCIFLAALSVYTCNTGELRLAAAVPCPGPPNPYRANPLLDYNTYQAFSGFDKIAGDKRCLCGWSTCWTVMIC